MRSLAVLVISFFFFYSFCDLEKGWQGLKIFDSSRKDVEKVLGKPVEETDGVVRYENEEARFRVLYAEGQCIWPDTLLGGFNVKKGTVLQYDVRPKKPLKIEDINWERDIYERAEDRHQLGFVHYYNRRDGIRITAETISNKGNEMVEVIYFERTPERATKFSCKK